MYFPFFMHVLTWVNLVGFLGISSASKWNHIKFFFFLNLLYSWKLSFAKKHCKIFCFLDNKFELLMGDLQDLQDFGFFEDIMYKNIAKVF